MKFLVTLFLTEKTLTAPRERSIYLAAARSIMLQPFDMKKIFRFIGILEALSFLTLVGIAMPLKYYYGMHSATQTPGMLHGLLFIAYVGLATYLAAQEKWPSSQLGWAYGASLFPLGTLLFDRAFLKNESSPMLDAL